jgi:ubiquinone/menaquinone biosynthesis C-methylase UbiE
MTKKADFYSDIHAFWNDRARLRQCAGSNDVIAKELEIKAIAEYVSDGMRLLEVGCGNGFTAIELARRYDIEIFAFDFAEKMIDAAKSMLTGQQLKGSVTFRVGDIRHLSDISQKFDLIYTERVLINLPDWPTQKQSIINIIELLSAGGLYVMCENSQDGLDKINVLREAVGLPKVEPPWHNCYFRDKDIETITLPRVILENVNCYSSTYYFLSRVVNAYLSAQEGKEPRYDAPVNQLALKLPSIGDFSQGKIWLWRKKGKDHSTSQH